MVLKISARQIFSIVTLVTLFCSAHAELIDESKTLVMTEGQAKEYYARTFAARDASWRVRPIISIPPQVRMTSKPGTRYRVTLKLLIDKHGNIIEATLLKSSGNSQLDASAIHSVKQAKLNPFVENGEAVMGQVFLPIHYIMQ